MRAQLIGCLLALSSLLPTGAATASAADIQTSERLSRGLVVVATTAGNLVQWRKFPTDEAEGITYRLRIYADASEYDHVNLASDAPTCYLDKTFGTKYTLFIKDASGATITSQTIKDVKPEGQVRRIKMNRPAGGTMGGSRYWYLPNDASVGDVDGDGDYELVIKWDPSNSRDNSQAGLTASTLYDCYEVTGPDAGRQLWRIDTGINVRSGAHYNPFLVYDFDGDGKAELVLKTAPGSRDASGAYVSDAGADASITGITTNGKDFRNSNGHVTGGEEFLTIFSGETGQALRTVWYNPNRGMTTGQASTYGTWESVAGKSTNYNRGERYNACVAYLDGLDQKPSIVMQRGYYTQAYFWAVDWDGTDLTTRWLHRGTGARAWSVVDGEGHVTASGSGKSSYGQGVHSISVGDVDGDGLDEIVMGSATIDHDGSLLCSTGFGHGDAIHLAKFMPDREGLQIYMPHEEAVASYGDDLHDAATGEILWRGDTSGDNGRGMGADMYYTFNSATGLDVHLGYEFWSAAEDKTPTNAVTLRTVGGNTSQNFRFYWDGDLYDEAWDGHYDSSTGLAAPSYETWDGTKKTTVKMQDYHSQSCNTTKATPCLSADIYGDWREEVILWDSSDSCTINIWTTDIPTEYPVPCLMTDHVYRMGVAWQNASYNQPPHLGYYLPDAFLARYVPADGSGDYTQEVEQDADIQPITLRLKNVQSVSKTGVAMQLGLNVDFDAEAQTLTISGSISKRGTFKTNVVTLMGKYNTCKVTMNFTVTEPTVGIEAVEADRAGDDPAYDLTGRRVLHPASGITVTPGRRILSR